MNIQKTSYRPAFGATFIKNKAIVDTLKYAENTGCLRTVDSALNNLAKADDGKILAGHGKRADGSIFSFFTVGRRTHINEVADATCPEEATLNGILEIGMLGKSYRSLFGVPKPKQNITAEKLIKEYTA
jgi:hypothetical protein